MIQSLRYNVPSPEDRASEKEERRQLRNLASRAGEIADGADALTAAINSAANLAGVRTQAAELSRQQGELATIIRRLARVVGGPAR